MSYAQSMVIYLSEMIFAMLVFGIYLKEVLGYKRPAYLLPVLWMVDEVQFVLMGSDRWNMWMNFVTTFTWYQVMAFCLCKGSWKKKFLFAMLYYVLAAFMEPLAIIIVLQLGIAENMESLVGNDQLLNVMMLFIQFALLFVVLLIRLIFKGGLCRIQGKKYNLGAVIISACCLVICIIQMAFMRKYNDFSLQNMLVLILLGSINFISYYFFMLGEEKNRLEMEYQRYGEQVKVYDQWIEEQKYTQRTLEAFRHDIKNHMSTLKGICEKQLESGEPEGITEVSNYLDSMGINYKVLKNEVESGNALLDAILNMKLNYAASKGIATKAEVKVPKEMAYDSLDMVIVLGNLLDNAIEACEQTEEQVPKKLDVCLTYDAGNLLLNLENSYNGGLDGKSGSSEDGLALKSSKKNKQMHGIGMQNVADVAKKYNGTLKWKGEDNVFYTEVFLYGVGKK